MFGIVTYGVGASGSTFFPVDSYVSYLYVWYNTYSNLEVRRGRGFPLSLARRRRTALSRVDS